MTSQASIGETLSRRREERELTAEQAAYRSKVPLRLVQALETDNYQLVPDPLYLIGLLRDYATFLDLDVAALETEFRQTIQRPPRPLVAAPASRPAPTIPWRQVAWTVAAILVVTPLLVIALSLATKRSSDQILPPPAAEPRVEDAVSVGGGVAVSTDGVPGGSPVSGSPAAGASVEPAARAITEPPVAIPQPAEGAAARRAASGHVLSAHAQEPTWISVRVDRQERREVLLQAGQTVRFEAETGFHVIVGNAGGVTLSLDGTPLPPLGRSGEVVRDLVLPPVPRDSPSSGTAFTAPTR